MPLTVDERFKSRRCEEGANPWEEREYLVINAATDNDARVAVSTYAPTTVPGRSGSSIVVTLGRVSIAVTPLGGTLYDATVRYAAGTIEPGNTTTRFRTSGGTQHVASSRAARRYGNPAAVIGDTGTLIGVQDDGTIDGLDVAVPVFEWSERHILSPATVTQAYIDTLYALTATCNNAPFRSRQAYEVLFLGCEGEQRRYGNWELDFTFAASPNATNLTIGQLTSILKRGWEYLEQRTRRTLDAQNRPTLRIDAVYVHEIFPAANFAALGIGIL